MRERFKNLIANREIEADIAEEYMVHSDHDEVHGDVDGAIQDHRDLLQEDQACIEQITNVKDLDHSNKGQCHCNLCTDDGKPKHNLLANRIMRKIILS